MARLPEGFLARIFFILDNYGASMLEGAGKTLLIAFVGTLIGCVIGFLCGIVKTIPLQKNDPVWKKWLLRVVWAVIDIYVEVFRGTPMMVQAMFIYYGSLLLLGIDMQFMLAAFFIVSINTGTYMAETVRGGILSIDKGQREAATAIGLTHWQMMTGVVLPQAVRNVMPAIGNEFIVNIKDSSVLNVISLSELYFTSKSVAGTYYRYFEVFFITSMIYLFLTITITRLLSLLEEKMDGPKHYTIHGSQSYSRADIKVNESEALPND